MNGCRRPRLIVAIVLSAVFCRVFATPEGLLQKTQDLRALADEARERAIPIVMLLSRSDCPYCDVLKAEVLVPSIRSGEYAERAIMRELMIDDGETVLGRDGKTVASATIAAGYGLEVTPTLLFLDAEGEMLAPPLVGLVIVDYYAHYLQRSLARAETALGLTPR